MSHPDRTPDAPGMNLGADSMVAGDVTQNVNIQHHHYAPPTVEAVRQQNLNQYRNLYQRLKADGNISPSDRRQLNELSKELQLEDKMCTEVERLCENKAAGDLLHTDLIARQVSMAEGLNRAGRFSEAAQRLESLGEDLLSENHLWILYAETIGRENFKKSISWMEKNPVDLPDFYLLLYCLEPESAKANKHLLKGLQKFGGDIRLIACNLLDQFHYYCQTRAEEDLTRLAEYYNSFLEHHSHPYMAAVGRLLRGESPGDDFHPFFGKARVLARSAPSSGSAKPPGRSVHPPPSRSGSKFRKKGVADIVFLLDVTFSMDPCIEALKKSLGVMIDSMVNPGPRAEALVTDWRIKICGYRDVLADGDLWWEEFPFSRDLVEIQGYLSRLEAKGGGDDPESLLDGLWKVAHLPVTERGGNPHPEKWRARGEAARCVIIFTDAPAHMRIDLQEARGAKWEDLAREIHAARLKITLYAPEAPCFETLSMLSDIEVETIGALKEAQEAMSRFVSSRQNFEKTLRQLARSITVSACTPTL